MFPKDLFGLFFHVVRASAYMYVWVPQAYSMPTEESTESPGTGLEEAVSHCGCQELNPGLGKNSKCF